MDDVATISFPIMQQMFKAVVELPTETEMEYWDDHYKEVPRDIRNMHMSKAENDLNALKLDKTFMTVYTRLPVDLQSCIPIMMAAKDDLEEIRVKNIEKISA